MHILGHIHDHGDVAALSRQARAAAARQYRSAKVVADPHGMNYIVLVARNHRADGHLPVIRAIGGIESPRAAVKSHLSAKLSGQLRRQQPSVDFSWFGSDFDE